VKRKATRSASVLKAKSGTHEMDGWHGFLGHNFHCSQCGRKILSSREDLLVGSCRVYVPTFSDDKTVAKMGHPIVGGAVRCAPPVLGYDIYIPKMGIQQNKSGIVNSYLCSCNSSPLHLVIVLAKVCKAIPISAERWHRVIRLGTALLLLFLGPNFFAYAQTANIALSVSPTPVPSGTPATISISVTDAGTGLGVISELGTCKILDTNANPVDSLIFVTDSNGNSSVTTSGTLAIGDYTAACTTSGSVDGSGFAQIPFQVVPGACIATDESTEDPGSQSPEFIIFDLTVSLDPTPLNSPSTTQETGTGVSGTNSGFLGCDANPISAPAAPPTLEPRGYTTRFDGGIDYSWMIHNYVYKPGHACTSGYCNGIQSLGTTESAPLDVTLTFSCN
jgi:hypothetical protein